MCIELDLIDGNVLFVEGTKIRANASRGKNHTRQYYEEQRGEIDKRIDELLEECERIDGEEGKQAGGKRRYMRDAFRVQELKVKELKEKFYIF